MACLYLTSGKGGPHAPCAPRSLCSRRAWLLLSHLRKLSRFALSLHSQEESTSGRRVRSYELRLAGVLRSSPRVPSIEKYSDRRGPPVKSGDRRPERQTPVAP